MKYRKGLNYSLAVIDEILRTARTESDQEEKQRLLTTANLMIAELRK